LVKIKNYFNIKNFQIDKPLVISDIRNAIYNNQGVVAVNDLRIRSVAGLRGERQYSEVLFDIRANTFKDIILPPPGHIFEVKFPNDDLAGVAI
jgi:hypothetical protein